MATSGCYGVGEYGRVDIGVDGDIKGDIVIVGKAPLQETVFTNLTWYNQ